MKMSFENQKQKVANKATGLLEQTKEYAYRKIRENAFAYAKSKFGFEILMTRNSKYHVSEKCIKALLTLIKTYDPKFKDHVKIDEQKLESGDYSMDIVARLNNKLFLLKDPKNKKYDSFIYLASGVNAYKAYTGMNTDVSAE